jgi:hypothetical protein
MTPHQVPTQGRVLTQRRDHCGTVENLPVYLKKTFQETEE